MFFEDSDLERDVIKRLIGSILITGAFVIGANGLMASQSSDAWTDQRYRAKNGRSSPKEEARLKTEQANTAYRETTHNALAPGNDWFEQQYKAKLGRNSPREEARLKTERASTAFREKDCHENTVPNNTWFVEQWYKNKLGRNSPREEALQKAACK